MTKGNIAGKSPIVKEENPGTYYWCACGLSNGQPFCDGSHKGTIFTPKAVEVADVKKIAWCVCKQSGNVPYCDGTHRNLE